mmetsp:Transcript_2442/g.3484  ORF Transcript_2442/g.3484 Transcript_2442/m.3484 type:complete len:436 (+) Transcript_2442:154-1461(+)
MIQRLFVFILALIAQRGLSVLALVSDGAANQIRPPTTALGAKSGMKTHSGYDYPNIYDESMPMLYSSQLVYAFAELVKAGRTGKLDLAPEILEKYKDQRLDVRNLNDGNGLPFNTIAQIVHENREVLKELQPNEFVQEIIAKVQAVEDADQSSDSLFLETFSSIDQATQCVYGVWKDTDKKRVVVVFRGSTDLSTRDWQTNFSAQMAEMRTPKLLVDKLQGKLKDRVLVHRGFYNYIFNNKKADGDQRFDMILDDIKPFVEDGYKIYVTGHSLGGALSSLLAFKLAGSNKSWIPKPISCISFASPFNGTAGFQKAFTQLEKMGLIRYLRITNDNDVVPTVPPFSLGLRRRLMKHVGINLRLKDNSFSLHHPNTNGLGNALRNSVVKPVWSVMKYHLLPLHDERMDKQQKVLQDMYLHDLYENEEIMGKGFSRDEL